LLPGGHDRVTACRRLTRPHAQALRTALSENARTPGAGTAGAARTSARAAVSEARASRCSQDAVNLLSRALISVAAEPSAAPKADRE